MAPVHRRRVAIFRDLFHSGFDSVNDPPFWTFFHLYCVRMAGDKDTLLSMGFDPARVECSLFNILPFNNTMLINVFSHPLR